MDRQVSPHRLAGSPARAAVPARAGADSPAATAGARAPQSALARGIHVLRCFSVAEPELSGRDLVARTGLPKPTLMRIVATLRQLGLLRHVERRNVYSLAPGAIALAAPALSAIGLRQVARPMMQALADHALGQVALAAGHADTFVYVEAVQHHDTLMPRAEIGAPASLTRSASGWALLTLLPPAELDTVVDRLTASDRARQPKLLARIAEARRELATLGYCVNRGELNRDLVSVAVPMPTVTGDGQHYVLACSVPAYRLNEQPELLSDLGPRLLALVESLRATTGGLRT